MTQLRESLDCNNGEVRSSVFKNIYSRMQRLTNQNQVFQSTWK